MAVLLTHQPDTPVADLLREMEELLREVSVYVIQYDVIPHDELAACTPTNGTTAWKFRNSCRFLVPSLQFGSGLVWWNPHLIVLEWHSLPMSRLPVDVLRRRKKETPAGFDIRFPNILRSLSTFVVFFLSPAHFLLFKFCRAFSELLHLPFKTLLRCLDVLQQ